MIETNVYNTKSRVIGVGKTGLHAACRMACHNRQIECLGVVSDSNNYIGKFSFVAAVPSGNKGEYDMIPLLSVFDKAEIVFVVASLDEKDNPLLAEVCNVFSARGEVTILVLLVSSNIPIRVSVTPKLTEHDLVTLDGIIAVPYLSLTAKHKIISIVEDDTLQNNSIQLAIQLVSELIARRSFVAMDLHDVLCILCGTLMRYGAGITASGNKAISAMEQAIACLEHQGVDLSGASRLFCTVSGSKSMTMDDFNSVGNYLRTQVGNNCDASIGCVIDESLGNNVMVGILIALKSFNDIIPGWVRICDRINRVPYIPRALNDRFIEE